MDLAKDFVRKADGGFSVTFKLDSADVPCDCRVECGEDFKEGFVGYDWTRSGFAYGWVLASEKGNDCLRSV